MAPTETIKLYAKAKGLGIKDYRSVSLDELKTLIANAEKGSTPAKGKTAPTANGHKGKAAATKATTTAVKGKAAANTPAKGKVSATPTKGKATATASGKAPSRTTAKSTATSPAKGKATTAPAAKSTARKSSSTTTAAKGKATRQSAPKGKATSTPLDSVIPLSQRKRATVSKEKGKRNFIDVASVDWTAESTVGRSGKRADVLKALRRFKGNYGKVFEHLKENAKVYYKGKNKAEAEHLLRWLITRVAYDFVSNTGQHEPGSRRAYGTAGTNGSSVRTEPVKGKAATTTRKPTGARKTAAKPATKARTSPAAKTAAQKRTAARGKVTRPVTRGKAATARKR